uniref:Uncharacterized protein n=1 Tax=Anguilla anguilla TaxID=7936 RepID=A0A0E9QNX1_ANGAN
MSLKPYALLKIQQSMSSFSIPSFGLAVNFSSLGLDCSKNMKNLFLLTLTLVTSFRT